MGILNIILCLYIFETFPNKVLFFLSLVQSNLSPSYKGLYC